MSTTKIIKGWVNPNEAPDVIFWHEQQTPIGEHSPTKPATLYIGTGKLWTEDEVRAMVREMVDGVSAGEELTQETIAAKHGLTL